jgi:hypothetical protein
MNVYDVSDGSSHRVGALKPGPAKLGERFHPLLTIIPPLILNLPNHVHQHAHAEGQRQFMLLQVLHVLRWIEAIKETANYLPPGDPEKPIFRDIWHPAQAGW